MTSPKIECPSCKSTLRLNAPPDSSATFVNCPQCHLRIPLTTGDDTEKTDHIEAHGESTDGSETLAAPPGPPRSTEFTFLAPPQQTDELGRLGPYRVLRKLGSGGMGAVFLAEDPTLRRKIALKVMLPHFASNAFAKARFLREARAQAAVEHDHIIAIYQVGEEGDVPFIAMPLLRGQTLADALKANPVIPLGEAVRIAREVAVGLAAAHQQNLVHRDIKPANVWLEGRSRRVKILDFGLAQGEEDGETTQELTEELTVVGTPAYMSPEQARGLAVDARTDLWSLGVMLYQMTTRELPFRGPTTGAILTALATDNPLPPSEKNPTVPVALSDLVMRLLAKSNADRPPNALAVVEALRAVKVSRSVGMSRASTVRTTPDPWEASADTEVDLEPVTDVAPNPSQAQSRPRMTGWIVVSALLLLATLAIVGAEIVVNKQSLPAIAGNTPRNETPPANAKAPELAKATPVVDERRAAEAALRLGFTIWINSGPQVRRVEDLPAEPLRLTGLVSSNRQITDADLANFEDCRNLTFLHLNPCSLVTDAGLANFKDCMGLAMLNVGNTQVSDDGLGYFKDCPNLQVLGLDNTKTSDRGLANFKDCKGLVTVWVNNTQITDVGLGYLKDCPKLEKLSLHFTNVTDAGLANFRGCKNLSYLSLGHTAASGSGLVCFKDAEKLAELSLHGCPKLTDDGLLQLKGWKSLVKLDVRETKVRAAALKELAAALPRCRIEWNGGIIEPK